VERQLERYRDDEQRDADDERERASDLEPEESIKRGTGAMLARSRVTNGAELLPGIDGRSIWARRFRDLIRLHLNDLGGEADASEAEKALVRRAAALIVELERLETKFALSDGATSTQLDDYQRATGALRRLLESLGLKRRLKDVTPTPLEYARRQGEAGS
jgi:hypothetical protein